MSVSISSLLEAFFGCVCFLLSPEKKWLVYYMVCDKELKILPLKTQYILSLALFIVNNKDNFVINSDHYSIHTRSCNNYHIPQANLTTCQKGVYYSGVKIFNNPPNDIKKFSYNSEKFKTSFKTMFDCALFLFSGRIF
jgi:hypothetical protein